MNKQKRIKDWERIYDEMHDPEKREEALRKQDIEQMKEERIKDTGLL